MAVLANKLVIVLACLSAVFAPVFTNIVLCVGANGHVAVEQADEAADCRESLGVLAAVGSDTTPCIDIPIPQEESVVQNTRLSPSETDWVLAPPLLDAALAAIFIAQADRSPRPPSTDDSPLATSPAVAQGVRTTVLLI